MLIPLMVWSTGYCFNTTHPVCRPEKLNLKLEIRKAKVRNPSLVSRAVQLDPRPRPSHPHESALVVWDSRTLVFQWIFRVLRFRVVFFFFVVSGFREPYKRNTKMYVCSTSVLPNSLGTVHQGHTSSTLPTSARAPVWDPPV